MKKHHITLRTGDVIYHSGGALGSDYNRVYMLISHVASYEDADRWCYYCQQTQQLKVGDFMYKLFDAEYFNVVSSCQK